ncbi:MAG: starch-binding protein [Bacteroidales bacterium]|nr:starch-binding protein [Bacteroidales bacterium]
MLLAILPFLAGCSKDEIIFDSELPRFELRAGYELLEVIMPQGTGTADKIYIIGDFNGGMEAVGDPLWELEKAPDTDVKWGIYLNPSTFKNGKTLADGYTFYSVEQGTERSLENDPVDHTTAPAVGQRANVIVYRWSSFFEKPQEPDEVQHDGYAIFVVDNTGWDGLAMYAYGDAEAFGGWPGIEVTGTQTIDGVTYKYFDTGAANEGLNLNLIFNNNGGGIQLADYNVTLNQDFYLELTANGVNEFTPSAPVEHDGYTVYVSDLSGWDALYLYMWGTVNDLNGGWPGMAPTGKQTINGVEYTYFDLGAGNCNAGLEEHVILNNNSGKQVDDVVVFNLDRDVYVELTSSSAREIDPDNYQPGAAPEQPSEKTEYKIYINNMTGWSRLYVYAWGDTELFGGWPGATATKAVYADNAVWQVYTVMGSGETENLIFNNNNGSQYDALTITLDKDYYIVAQPDKAVQVTKPANISPLFTLPAK